MYDKFKPGDLIKLTENARNLAMMLCISNNNTCFEANILNVNKPEVEDPLISLYIEKQSDTMTFVCKSGYVISGDYTDFIDLKLEKVKS